MKLSILHRLLFTLFSVITLFGMVLWSMGSLEQQRLREVTRADSEIHRRVFDRAWNLQGRALRVFSDDYSRWDDIVEFVKHPTSEWIALNLDAAVLRNAEAEFVWVMTPKGETVVAISDNPKREPPKLQLNWNRLAERIRHEKFVQFFQAVDGRIFEFAAAGIVPSTDVERATPAQGILLAARAVDEVVFNRMENLTNFQISLTREHANPLPFSLGKDGSVTINRALPALEGGVAGWVSGALRRKTFEQVARSQQQQWFMLLGGNTLLFLVVALLFWTWIGHPMNLLSESLQTGDAAKIQDLRKDNSELGRFAAVLTEFYADKERLAQEVKERVAAEAALRKSEELFRAVFNQALQVIVMLRPDGTVIQVNTTACSLTGRDPEMIEGKRLPELPWWKRPAHAAATLETALADAQSEGPTRFELDIVNHDGSVSAVDFSLKAVSHEGDRDDARLLLLEGRDVTAHRLLEAEVVQAADEERRKIGLELHDGLCQELTATDFFLKRVELRLRDHECPGAPDLRESRVMLGKAINDARDVARLLGPISLSDKGLPFALEQLAINVSHRFGVVCDIQIDEPPEDSCPEELAKHLLRIAQEAVQNAVRHGKATALEIRFNHDRHDLLLEIADNGSGLPPETLALWNAKPERGLRTIHYRTRLVGGTIVLTENEPHGLIVACRVPLR